MVPGVTIIKTDIISAATHEVGHALVQAVLEIGPQLVKLIERDGCWGGQSLPFQKAENGDNFPRLLVSQLGGPISQICIANQSLERFKTVFASELLVPAIKCDDDGDRPLHALRWESDLHTGWLLGFARSIQNVRSDRRSYKMGGFLFDAERILFSAFSESSLKREICELTKKLVETRLLEGAKFVDFAKTAIDNSVWLALHDLNLDFLLLKN